MDEVRGSRSAASDSESLILVDEADREVGHLDKAQCHQGQGVLHRAFSLLIFNDAGELLLQQRSASKRLWPLFWSNSCCSHPRRAETMEAANGAGLAAIQVGAPVRLFIIDGGVAGGPEGDALVFAGVNRWEVWRAPKFSEDAAGKPH